MDTFNIKSPLDWNAVKTNEILQFEAYGRERSVTFTVIATEPVAVYLSFEPDLSDSRLVGVGDHQQISYTTAVDTYIEIAGPDDVSISVRSPASVPVVPKTDEEKYTNPFPQGRRNSDLDKIMHLVNINEQRREQKLQVTIDQMKAAQIQAVEAAKAAGKSVDEMKTEETNNDLSEKEAAKAD